MLRKNGRQLQIQLTSERKATVTISNGIMEETVKVVQSGQKEFINIALDKLEFGSKGEIKELPIKTNTEWEVINIPSWCEVIAKDSDKLILKVGNFFRHPLTEKRRYILR